MAKEQKEKDNPGQVGWITVYLATDDGEKPFRIHPGVWQVDALKSELGIGEELILASVVNEEVTKFPDGGKVRPFDGQVFFGQSRGGGAS